MQPTCRSPHVPTRVPYLSSRTRDRQWRKLVVGHMLLPPPPLNGGGGRGDAFHFQWEKRQAGGEEKREERRRERERAREGRGEGEGER